MTAPVDVVAMMDALLAFASRGVETDDPARPMIERGHEARAAVAELIDADREYDAADVCWSGERYERDDYGIDGSDFWRCMDCGNESGAGVLNKGVTHEPACRVAAIERAIERRRAALARVGAK